MTTQSKYLTPNCRPKFNNDFSGFAEDDLEESFERLSSAALIAKEEEVDGLIESFSISGDTIVVGEGKRKSALFIAYLTWMSSRTLREYDSGAEIEVTDLGRELTEVYFGKAIIDNPKTHPVPAALLKQGATIRINWKNPLSS